MIVAMAMTMCMPMRISAATAAMHQPSDHNIDQHTNGRNDKHPLGRNLRRRVKAFNRLIKNHDGNNNQRCTIDRRHQNLKAFIAKGFLMGGGFFTNFKGH